MELLQLPDLLENFDAAPAPRQADIQHHQIHGILDNRRDHLATAVLIDGIAPELQHPAQGNPRRTLVVHDQNPRAKFQQIPHRPQRERQIQPVQLPVHRGQTRERSFLQRLVPRQIRLSGRIPLGWRAQGFADQPAGPGIIDYPAGF